MIESSWHDALLAHLPAVDALAARLEAMRAGGTPIHPPADRTFAAFEYSPLPRTRIVIVGQDPYHGPGQAIGLAFAVPRGVRLPPSLRNIYTELVANDVGVAAPPAHGDLTAWAHRGCLLLNTALSVVEGRAGSHASLWQPFTRAVLEALAAVEDRRLVVLLWGRHAQQQGAVFHGTRHHVLEAAHPSPLSARNGFFGCRHFARANELLAADGGPPMDWTLPD